MFRFLIMLTAFSAFLGCKSQQIENNESALQSTAGSGEADTFTTIDDGKFEELRYSQGAEFYGCLCVNQRSQWKSWKFMQVANHGYKAAVSSASFPDLEACVSDRESSQTCGG